MPWSTPLLKQVRSTVRDYIAAKLPGADANVPNSVLRVLSDVMGALCHLALQYIDWLALQLLPDTSETEWLDRHGHIWLTNADGSTGRKLATLAVGQASFTATSTSTIVPLGTQLVYAGTNITYETTADIHTVQSGAPTPAPISALDPGSAGNLDPGTTLGLLTTVPGIDSSATVVLLDGGTDQETDDELRARVLQRIQQPPMGGDAQDYINWVLRVPGVTRAWSYPLEMGIGTVTVRFMMDELRASNNGFPLQEDVNTVSAFLDKMRPVAVKDFFVVAPIPFPITIGINNLITDSPAVRAAIEASIDALLMSAEVSPGQEIYASWVSEAISETAGVDHFDMQFANTPMPSDGYLPVLGTISYAIFVP